MTNTEKAMHIISCVLQQELFERENKQPRGEIFVFLTKDAVDVIQKHFGELGLPRLVDDRWIDGDRNAVVMLGGCRVEIVRGKGCKAWVGHKATDIDLLEEIAKG